MSGLKLQRRQRNIFCWLWHMTGLQCKIPGLEYSRKQLSYLCLHTVCNRRPCSSLSNSNTCEKTTMGSEGHIRGDQYFFGSMPPSYKYGNLSLKFLFCVLLGFLELSHETEGFAFAVPSTSNSLPTDTLMALLFYLLQVFAQMFPSFSVKGWLY